VDEEIIGDESPAYQPHIQGGDEFAQAQSKLSPGGTHKRAQGPAYKYPPAPIRNGEEEKESAKARLQRLIRDFAHDTVGPGIEIDAQSKALETLPEYKDGSLPSLLRMDRRLSRLELWPLSSSQGTGEGTAGQQATYSCSLQMVASIQKGSSDGGSGSDTERENATLVIVQRDGHDLRIIFNGAAARDKAYTCLRIFQMSVDQSPNGLEGQSREDKVDSDMASYEPEPPQA
jgi:hypothetical protein